MVFRFWTTWIFEVKLVGEPKCKAGQEAETYFLFMFVLSRTKNHYLNVHLLGNNEQWKHISP